MNAHETIHSLVRIQKIFSEIKLLSGSAAIDRLCVEGIVKSVEIGNGISPEKIQAYKKKHADAMA